MERLTWVDEDGTILFKKPNQLLGDLAFTITELAKNEEYDFLEVIAERLANREQAAELYKRKYKEAWAELSVEREKRKWIPVEERTPEDRTAVIATVLHRKWICDHDLDESEQTIYPERHEVCTVYRDGDKYIKLDEGYTETIVVPVGKQDDDIAYPVEEVIAWMPLPEAYHPETEDTASEPPEWEKRMMNTFLGSRQEKKTDKTGTAEKPEKERL